MKYLLLCLCLAATSASCTIIDDAFATPGEDVLGVDLIGDLTVVLTTPPNGYWEAAVIGGAGFTWSAAHYCTMRESSWSEGAIEAVKPDGLRRVQFDVPESELSGLCSGGDGWGNLHLYGVTGRVFAAAPTSQTEVDRLRIAGTTWAGAVAANLLRCGRYHRDTGAKIADVPCADGLGGVLAPVLTRRGGRLFAPTDDPDAWLFGDGY